MQSAGRNGDEDYDGIKMREMQMKRSKTRF